MVTLIKCHTELRDFIKTAEYEYFNYKDLFEDIDYLRDRYSK